MIETNKIYCDCLEVLKTFPDKCINMVMTSPPYWALRDYGIEGQLGLEKTFEEYITKLCDIFDEIKRVLRDDGTIWVNLGDTYGGANSRASNNGRAGYGNDREGVYSRGQDKSLCCIPDRFKIEMINRGWICRNEIIWYKKNCMPSSVKDRFTVDYEKIFFFSKNKKYYFEQQFEEQTTEPFEPRLSQHRAWDNDPSMTRGKGENSIMKYNPQGRNKRCVWTINTKPYKEAHFAVFPPELCETPIKAGCPENGIVLDPFFGSGTVGLVADKLNRKWIGIELNPKYCEIAEKRLQQETLHFGYTDKVLKSNIFVDEDL